VSIEVLDEMQAALRSPLDESETEEATRGRAAEDILLALVELDPNEAAFANSLGLIWQEKKHLVEAAELFLRAAQRTEALGAVVSDEDRRWIDAWRRNASVCLSQAGLPLSAAVVAQPIGDSEYREEAQTALQAARSLIPDATIEAD